jgi:hypothetical protein
VEFTAESPGVPRGGERDVVAIAAERRGEKPAKVFVEEEVKVPVLTRRAELHVVGFFETGGVDEFTMPGGVGAAGAILTVSLPGAGERDANGGVVAVRGVCGNEECQVAFRREICLREPSAEVGEDLCGRRDRLRGLRKGDRGEKERGGEEQTGYHRSKDTGRKVVL